MKAALRVSLNEQTHDRTFYMSTFIKFYTEQYTIQIPQTETFEPI